ncbi:hypothetical protein ACOMHN_034512 [Nucella lapillus]
MARGLSGKGQSLILTVVNCGQVPESILTVVSYRQVCLLMPGVSVNARCVAVVGGGVVTGNKDGWLHVWDMDLGQVVTQLHAHTGAVTCINSKVKGAILTGSQDRCVKLWKPPH